MSNMISAGANDMAAPRHSRFNYRPRRRVCGSLLRISGEHGHKVRP